MDNRFQGLIAATHTPFDAQGELHLASVESQAAWLSTSQVRGVYVCGTTGEGVSLSIAERKALVQRWIDIGKGEFKIIAHVGHHSLPEAVELARHAQRFGVDAVSAIAPGFLKPSDVESLVRFCAAVAAAAPDRPFYYYHSPGMTGCTLPLRRFTEQASECIPTFAGIKFNDPDLLLYQQTLAAQNGTLDVPFGVDEAMLGGLACGATSAIGSTYNYAAPHFHRLIQAFEDGRLDDARRLSEQVGDLIALLQRYGAIAAGKALMKLRGVTCGAPRLPLATLSAARERELLDTATQLAVLEDASPLPAAS